jgi:hypothetical protein
MGAGPTNPIGSVTRFDCTASEFVTHDGCGLLLISSATEISDDELELWELAVKHRRSRIRLIATGATPSSIQSPTSSEALHDQRAVEPPFAVPLTIIVHGQSVRRFRSTLPFRFTVSSAANRAAIAIEIEDGGFAILSGGQYSVATQAGMPIGACELVLDGEPRPDGRDQLKLSTTTPLRSVTPSTVESLPKTRFNQQSPVNLYILIDRTTLDRDAWLKAFDAVTSLDATPSADSAFWNSSWRRSFAAALIATQTRLHGTVRFGLYWFADREREDCVPHPALPLSRSASGELGEVGPDVLRVLLESPELAYATGIDFFDAVDEGLECIRRVIDARAANEQSAVLIVGDSPPPPAGDHDPLWVQLAAGPIRTSARRSELFQSVISHLQERRIPVGWLFLRDARPPQASRPLQPGDDRLAAFSQFRDWREKTFRALQAFDWLDVEGCDDIGEMQRPLGILLSRLATVVPPRLVIQPRNGDAMEI